jgi:type IV pilus assembly protein PilY1
MKNKSGRSFGFPVFWSLLVLFLLSIDPSAVFAEFTPRKDLFSAEKDTPLGFTNLVEPNVLLLIDTSGSMAYRMRSSTSTYGDGTNPYNFGGSTTYNYFGADQNTGRNTTGNNDVSVDYNYHPLLRYIPEEILPGNTSYFSYDVVTETGEGWENSRDGGFLPDGYRLNTSDGRLEIRYVWFIFTLWRNVEQNESKPEPPSGYRWDWQSGAWYLQKYGTYTVTKNKYKYPNDSRMYTLKNVMHRILTDSTLVGNLRLALSSFRQTEYTSGSTSSYYRWSPSSGGSYQRISWKYPSSSANRAMLRVNFGSTTKLPGGPAHLESIKQWFDGTESSSNPEFRADGNTPLATSIWYNSSESAGAYFKAVGDEMDWCQDNWLIVLTDGANNDGEDEEEAVTRLYNMTITLPNGRQAKKVKTFVIGLIDPDEQTSLRDTLNTMAANGQTEKAYFATDMEGLLAAFKEIFQTIQDFAATGSAPLVNPPKSAGSEGKVYSTGFKPKSDQQWMGYLYSYTISDDVLVTDKDWWEAGAKLNSTAYSARQIYTVDWDGSTTSNLSGSNLKNFLSTQVEALRPLLAGSISTTVLSNAKLAQFINWVRGLDVWDETEGSERWKLGDPYHVGLVEVGAPQSLLKDQAYRTFAETYKKRGKFVYLHANDGMVHSFASETNPDTDPKTTEGLEKWAFIPPNVLGYRRLLGMKIDESNTWVSNEKYSNAQYLLDGPLVAEDVSFGGAYHTVLLGSLGRAGAGMYALDITNPVTPQFLWALENNHYDQVTMAVRPVDERTFLKWDKASSGSSTAVLSTSESSASTALGRLRLTVSTPFIGTVDINNPSGTDVITKWVGLFGAGAQYSYSDTDADGGKAVYVIDMENGNRIKELTHTDLGMAVAPLSVETGPRPLRIKNFYLGDHRGAVFEGDASAASTDSWTLQRVFTPGEVTDATVVGIPYAVEIGIIKNRKWLFWGTGDPDGLFGEQTGQNYIVALNRNTAGPDTTYTDLEGLARDTGDSVAQTLNGWYLPLASSETVTTPPVLYKGYLFIATYAPVLNDNCAIGDSYFYILKADTGLGGWIDASGNEKKYVKLDATRISGITVSGGKLYVGVTRYPGASNTPSEMGDVTISGNLMVFDIPDHIKNSEDGPESQSIRPTYWRDWKP